MQDLNNHERGEDIFLTLSKREKLNYLFTVFEMQGRSLYLVGGAVRDILMGLEPKDYDLATDARPEEIISWFDHTVEVGKSFGTVNVILGEDQFEITTFRHESDYRDGRHPDKVSYADSFQEDARRRDFTVNALYMDRFGSVFDLFGGVEDIQNGMIRCVGKASSRFQEDRLRMWRCVRLAAEKGFEIDAGTRIDLEFDPNTDQIAYERIRDELIRILMAKKVNWGGYLLVRTNLFSSLMKRIFPEGDEIDPEAMMERFSALSYLPMDLEIRLSYLLSFMTEQDRMHFMKTMRFSKQQIKWVETYQVYLDTTIDSGKIAFKSMLADLGLEKVDLLTHLQEEIGRDRDDQEQISAAQRGRFQARQIYINREPLHLSELAMSGSQVRKYGFKHEQIGEMLNYLLYCVYEEPSLNTREELNRLLEEAKEEYGKKSKSTAPDTLPSGQPEADSETELSERDSRDTP